MAFVEKVKVGTVGLAKKVGAVAVKPLVVLHGQNNHVAIRATLHKEFDLGKRLNRHAVDHQRAYLSQFEDPMQAVNFAVKEFGEKNALKVAHNLGLSIKPQQDISLRGLGNVLGALAKGFTGRKG